MTTPTDTLRALIDNQVQSMCDRFAEEATLVTRDGDTEPDIDAWIALAMEEVTPALEAMFQVAIEAQWREALDAARDSSEALAEWQEEWRASR